MNAPPPVMLRSGVSVIALAGVALAGACRPELGDRESLITGTRVLAVRGDPPEAAPGESVRYSLLVANPDGPVASPRATWAYCATPKLLTENGAVSAACLSPTNSVRPLAEGPNALEAAMPADACALFGPEVTSADLRPRDADVTGGYFQPLRVTVFDGGSSTVALGLERIACSVANVGAEDAREFTARYVTNENPELGSITASLRGSPVPLDAIPRGERITLHATWSDRSPERYVVFDLASRRIVERREAMRVSWFVTAGEVESDRTGRSEDELETFTDNDWQAPADARSTHLFVVLRDARGGVAFTAVDLVTR